MPLKLIMIIIVGAFSPRSNIGGMKNGYEIFIHIGGMKYRGVYRGYAVWGVFGYIS